MKWAKSAAFSKDDPDIMFEMDDFEARIDKIARLSPQAAQLVETEGYRTRLETDEVSPRAVLEDLMIALLEDMQNLGIEFHCAPGELFNSYFMFDRLMELFELLMPVSLYRHLAQEPRLRTVLSNLLDGSVDEGDTTAVAWIRFLGYANDKLSEKYEEAAEHLLDKICSTPVFDTMVTNLLALDPTALPAVDADRAASYHAWVERLDHKLTSLADGVFTRLRELEAEPMVRRRIKSYIMELTRADKLDLYSWLFLLDSASPSVVEQQLRMERMREFTTTTKFHPDYYASTQAPVDVTAVICLLLRQGADAKDREHFRTLASNLQATLSHNGTSLTPVESAAFTQVTRAIADCLEKPQ